MRHDDYIVIGLVLSLVFSVFGTACYAIHTHHVHSMAELDVMCFGDT